MPNQTIITSAHKWELTGAISHFKVSPTSNNRIKGFIFNHNDVNIILGKCDNTKHLHAFFGLSTTNELELFLGVRDTQNQNQINTATDVLSGQGFSGSMSVGSTTIQKLKDSDHPWPSASPEINNYNTNQQFTLEVPKEEKKLLGYSFSNPNPNGIFDHEQLSNSYQANHSLVAMFGIENESHLLKIILGWIDLTNSNTVKIDNLQDYAFPCPPKCKKLV